ncbi:MAG: SDR family oxidoreductase [Calditrichaceae bacterium]|nr:SDR family oxidoreductase [Calditrichaceae bacterium]MBN2710560.1 SDR family oxidoreductase [Calditrichaceae bacterium]RQV96527.1 MAG: SDR family oxidoreductase [Calditrichota bacterium]
MTSLNNKTVLITGATSGIGLACAEVFAAKGAKLIITGRRENRLKELSERFNKEYKNRTCYLCFDIREYEQVKKTIRSLPDDFREIDILINNAGLAAGLEKVQEASVENWERMINTNIKGLLYMTREVLPGMIERQRGHIINIGSTAGHEVYPKGSVYCATKHAVDALTRGIRMDVMDTPIRVSTVDPGLVETEFSIVRFNGDKNQADNVYKGMTPLTGTDVAETVLFVATRPPHVQIAEVIIMATDQGSAVLVHRKK